MAQALPPPDGWLETTPDYGSPIHRIIPCKVPLKEAYGQRWSPKHLIDSQYLQGNPIGLVVDLTVSPALEYPRRCPLRLAKDCFIGHQRHICVHIYVVALHAHVCMVLPSISSVRPMVLVSCIESSLESMGVFWVHVIDS